MTVGKLASALALFVIVGVPITAYLWETLNLLLQGKVPPARILTTLPVALLFVGLLVLLARVIERLETVRLKRAAAAAEESS